MGTIRVILLLCGAALLLVLINHIGLLAIASAFSQLSWKLLVVICFPALLVTVFDTLGWRFAFPHDWVPFRTLLSTCLAGEAFSLTTPTASVGGDAVKAWLLRDRVSLDVSVPSVIVAKTTSTIAQSLFLCVGIAGAWWTLPPDSGLLRGMTWLLAVEIIAIGGFVIAQVGGVLTTIPRAFERLGWRRLSDRAHVLFRLDRALSDFYRQQPRRLSLSIGSHFIGWILGVGETYLILLFLGTPVSLVMATVIEALEAGVHFATFFVPARLGVLEGGQMVIFGALGLGMATGLSATLVSRVRQATWVAIGLIALAAMHPAFPGVPAPARED